MKISMLSLAIETACSVLKQDSDLDLSEFKTGAVDQWKPTSSRFLGFSLFFWLSDNCPFVNRAPWLSDVLFKA